MNSKEYEVLKEEERKTITKVVVCKYILGDIDKLIKFVNSKSTEVWSDTNSEYEKLMEQTLAKLLIYVKVIQTKKIFDSTPKDFIKIGEQIHLIADKMIEYGQTHENKKAENFEDKIMKVFFG